MMLFIGITIFAQVLIHHFNAHFNDMFMNNKKPPQYSSQYFKHPNS